MQIDQNNAMRSKYFLLRNIFNTFRISDKEWKTVNNELNIFR